MKPFPNKFWPLLIMYCKSFKWQICLFLVITIIGSLFGNLNKRFFADIIGTIKENDTNSYNEAIFLVYLLIGSYLLNILFSNYSKYFFSAKIIVPFKILMEKDLFSYLLGHSYEYITNKQSGMLIAYKNQVTNLPKILDRANWDLRAIIDLIIKTIMLTMISPVIGITYLFLCFFTIFPGKYFTNMLKKVNKLHSQSEALVSGRMLDVVNNLDLVKQFDNIENEKKQLRILFKQEYDIAIKSVKIFFAQFSTVGIVTSFASFILLILSVYYWSIEKISTADVVFVLMTLISGLNMIGMIFDGVQKYRQDIAKIEKGLEIFADKHGIVDKKNAKNLKIKNGRIEFKDISFRYKNKRKYVFDRFNLTINAHEKVGIVGKSGSGKTTLINLLQRAFELNSGKILIDGFDITDVTQESLHKNISIIPQDTVMFNRNIAQNIAFGSNTKSIKKIKDAAIKAYAHNFILEKDGAYESYAGDRGCKLSGGERQRIAIARAILKNAPILILDEATSSLDTQSEQIINKAIENVIKNQTVIAIAHRLSTLKSMDRIVVLDKGKIIEEGSFEELLSLGGKFAKLYLTQQKKKGGKNV